MTFIDTFDIIKVEINKGAVNMGLNFGYIRVSTKEQNLDRQVDALLPYVSKDDDGNSLIYQDKASGKDMEREGFKEMLRAMRKGDTLYVKSIDRIGRNKHQIKEHLERFKQKGITVRVIDLPTTMIDFPEGNEWVMEMINNILIEVLASIAQQERETLLQRQAEGIQSAKKKGKHLGRPAINLDTLSKEQRKKLDEYYPKWKEGKITAVRFYEDILKLTKSTFYKIIKQYEDSKTITN